MEISVIVPVYNVEKYLAECLESILSQQFCSMEIICVDDCSSDDSLKVLESFAQKDSKIRIKRHNTNRGPSAARNTALKYATGKYVLFVDSDDLLAPDALNILFSEAEEKKVDIVYFDYEKFYDSIPNYENYSRGICNNYVGLYTGREFFCETVKNNEFTNATCGQFIRREFLIEHNISFLEGILHEDNLFSFYIAMEAQRVINLSKKFYYYRQREKSIMKTKDSKRAQSLFVILAEMLVYWKTHDFTQEESFYIGKLWGSLYETYKLYKAYGDISTELQCGDEIEKTIYSLINNYNEKKWLNIEKLPLDKIRKAENVIVYGAGMAAKQVVEYLRINYIDVGRIMVETLKDNPNKFCGIKVYQIDECMDVRNNSMIIIGVTSKYSNGIKNMLKDNGFENVILLPDNN